MKLFVTDLDGTLLNRKKEISFTNKQAIQQAVKKGHPFAIATGRSVSSAQKILKELEVEGYILALNGTYVVKAEKNGKVIPLLKGKLARPTLLKAFQQALDNQLTFMVNGPEKSYRMIQDKDTQVLAESVNRSNVFLLNQEEMFQLLTTSEEDFLKIVFHSDNSKVLVALKKALKAQQISSIFSDTMYLEILPADTNKGTSLSFLAEHLDISLKDTVAFGDQENDLELLQTAGISYAMDNAVPKVKNIAKYVTLTNEESGVGIAIENLI